MKFNPEISLGTLIEIGMFAIAAAGLLVKFGKLEQKVNIMWAWFAKVAISRGISVKEDNKFFGVED